MRTRHPSAQLSGMQHTEHFAITTYYYQELNIVTQNLLLTVTYLPTNRYTSVNHWSYTAVISTLLYADQPI
jgi:hypothetical protein